MHWLALGLLLLPASVLAKERTAGCAGFPRAFMRIQNAIQLGAPTWNQGNQLGTYAIYRDTTRGILDELVKDRSCGTIYDMLSGALERAHKEHTPGAAGWDLRHGFDAFLEIVARGDSPKLPQPRLVERAVAPFYDRDCPDLFALVQRAERALADGKGEDEARKLATELHGGASCPRLGEALAAAVKKKQGAAALDRFISGQPPAGDPDEPPAILRRCTSAPALVEEITFAVLRGKPRLLEGHSELAVDIYRKMAEGVLVRRTGSGRCEEAARLLRKGLDDAKKEREAKKAAETLENAFNAIGEQFVKSVPQ